MAVGSLSSRWSTSPWRCAKPDATGAARGQNGASAVDTSRWSTVDTRSITRNRGEPVDRTVDTSRWSAPQRPASPAWVARAIVLLNDTQKTFQARTGVLAPARARRSCIGQAFLDSDDQANQPNPAHVRAGNAHGERRCQTPCSASPPGRPTNTIRALL